MRLTIFDERICDLGEGPLWHPERRELFWFDITGRRMLARREENVSEWRFDEMHSAAGWIDHRRLLLASETGLWLFDLAEDRRERLCALEAGNPLTRSNDGRADPQGGFWVGTMSKTAEKKVGAIWRWYRGELRRLFGDITIPNAICFTPDGREACFADTASKTVMRQPLDIDGWPLGSPQPWLRLGAEGLNPDGAVFDAEGVFWVAQWGTARVAAYGPDGQFLRALEIPAPHASCPAFGGHTLDMLFCTSALEGMDATAKATHPFAGMTFAGAAGTRGQAEHRVTLG